MQIEIFTGADHPSLAIKLELPHEARPLEGTNLRDFRVGQMQTKNVVVRGRIHAPGPGVICDYSRWRVTCSRKGTTRAGRAAGMVPGVERQAVSYRGTRV